MACLPNSSKCEWSEIKLFVSYYNEKVKCDFEHDCCLDVEYRDRPEPEVLCKDSENNCLVIERKTCMWPIDAVERHKAEHIYYDQIFLELRSVCGDTPFSLYTSFPETIDHEALKALAIQVSEQIKEKIEALTPGDEIIITDPVRTIFKRENVGERNKEERRGGLVIKSYEEDISDLYSFDTIPDKFKEMIRKYINSTEKKFSKYEKCKRILLLNIISGNLYSLLDENWWQGYFKLYLPVIDSIDEIWISFNYGDSWNFDKIYSS